MTMLLITCTEKRAQEYMLDEGTPQIVGNKSGDERLTEVYNQAISDYIMEVSKQNLMTLDTLFFIKRNNGQPDDFPNIILPEMIHRVQIRWIEPKLGKKANEKKSSRIYINMMGWVDKNDAEFIFVTFTNGFEHKFDHHINYSYNSNQRKFKLTKSLIEVYRKNGKNN